MVVMSEAEEVDMFRQFLYCRKGDQIKRKRADEQRVRIREGMWYKHELDSLRA